MLKIQKLINQFSDIESANFFLMNKLKLDIRKEVLKESIKTTAGDVESAMTLYLYNYTDKTPRSDLAARDARGLILNEHGRVISQSIPRFFDIGEKEAGFLDWEDTVAESLEDGIFINVYYFDGKWRIQTRYSAFGKEPLKSSTCEELVRVMLSSKYNGTSWIIPFAEGDEDWCWTFELIQQNEKTHRSPHKLDLVLLSIYDKYARQELIRALVDDIAQENRLLRPKRLQVKNLTDVEKVLMQLDDSTDAGLILVDKNFKRVRIRNLRYEAPDLSKYGSDLKPRHFIDLIFNGGAELASREAPEYKELIDHMVDELEFITNGLRFEYTRCKNIKDNKSFARAIKSQRLSEILFALRKGKIMSIEEGIANYNYDKLAEMIRDNDRKEFDEKFQNVIILENKRQAEEG